MITLNKFYIDGKWVDPVSATPFPIMNPGNNQEVGTVMLGSPADVDVAVAAAATAFETYSKTPKAERIALLQKLESVFTARLEEMAQAITTEMGAPITMSREMQAACGIDIIKDFIEALERQPEEEELPNFDILIREPIGVCGLITPWNWPINQIVLKVASVLAVGSTCVLKPSEYTPLSAALFAEFVHEAGYPDGAFNLVFGDGPNVGAAISRHPDIAAMSFTGSTRAGVLVSKDAAETVKRVTLELGGKSPNVVFADADLETCIPAAVEGCFYNTGQSCNAPTRLLVEQSCYDKAVAIAEKAGAAQSVGDPAVEGDHIGPLFDKLQYDRVQAMIEVGLGEDARLLVGGLGKPEGLEEGWFVKPTIFADVTNEMRIAREEIFGPVLVIIPFADEAEAVTIANDTEYGLAAYLQTGDKERAKRVASLLRAGTITINGKSLNYGSPFGGFKQSGNGREGGVFGLEDFQEIKVRSAI
jgi:aldehyde dehydrogenase (NAD+)